MSVTTDTGTTEAMTERLYALLPAIYRQRDADVGLPLRALLDVVAEQAGIVEDDIARLYDDWFIETCETWLVPYIGDLLGVRPLHPIPGVSLRAHVANTLSYRRRKGTAAVLERLAQDTTGWSARAVEFFGLLATSQHLNHLRPDHPATASLRDADRLELTGGPFERLPYGAEVRRIASGRGRYGIPNLGLYLWRLRSYPVTRGTVRPVADPADGRYTFDPLGLAAHPPGELRVPLFHTPRTAVETTHRADESDVPGELRRRPIFAELEARRRAVARGDAPTGRYFGEAATFAVYVGGAATPLPPEEVVVCDLAGWDAPGWTAPASVAFAPGRSTKVAVDPQLGRLAALQGATAAPTQASYGYGFGGDLGGGPYPRWDAEFETWAAPDWHVGVGKDGATVGSGTIYPTLSEAVDAWNDLPAAPPEGRRGVIAVLDSQSYRESLTGSHEIVIPERSRLLVIAADWPVVETPPGSGHRYRKPGRFVPDGVRPHLRGDLAVHGTAPAGSGAPGGLVVDGLLIEGSLTVRPGNLGTLTLRHATLVPSAKGLTVEPSTDEGRRNHRLSIELLRVISGPISVPGETRELRITESIVDAAGASEDAVDAPSSAARIVASTLLGRSRVRTLEADGSLFMGVVTAERRQQGCARFCFFPEGSRTPRRYRCQPDLETDERLAHLAAARKAAGVARPSRREREAVRAEVGAWLTPDFTSIGYGQPAYGQLGRTCPRQIAGGAEDGSEMGAFGFLRQPQREANLRTALEEYLRLGLEAGWFFVT
jgi:hypothetical protein